MASHFAGNDENAQQTDEEIVLAALDNTADDQLTGFALRLALTDHVGIPPEDEPDPLSEAEAAFAPPSPKSSKPKNTSKSKETPSTLAKAAPKKSVTKKQKAAEQHWGGNAPCFLSPGFVRGFLLERLRRFRAAPGEPALVSPGPSSRSLSGPRSTAARQRHSEERKTATECGLPG